MNPISRRAFLQMAGITWLSSHLLITGGGLFSRLQGVVPTPALSARFGRVLRPAHVYGAPSQQSGQVALLWPDAVVSLRDARNEWYRLSNGFVRQADIQPMFGDGISVAPVALNAWGEVAAPAAAIRAWCAADAPLVRRVGHGAVLRVVDMLPPTRTSEAWVAIGGEDNVPDGWVPAGTLQPLVHPTLPVLHLEFSTAQLQVTAFVEDQPLLRAPFTTGKSLVKGEYHLKHRQPTRNGIVIDDQVFDAVPHVVELDSGDYIVGAYWHHQFGQRGTGDPVQVSPLVARWWYAGITADSRITIR